MRKTMLHDINFVLGAQTNLGTGPGAPINQCGAAQGEDDVSGSCGLPGAR